MEDIKTISRLFERYLNGECTRNEVRSLLQYFGAGENEAILKSLIHQHLEAASNADESSSSNPKRDLPDEIFVKIKRAIDTKETKGNAPIFRMNRRTWSIVAAAVLLLLISTTALVLVHKKEASPLAKNDDNSRSAKDIAPGHDGAVLTLANGSAVVLDGAANGTLAKQGSFNVVKINGQVSYYKSGDKNMDEAPVYNAVSTARGNQYQLLLADGTKVWLNASSSIRFPVYFTGSDRKVEITGEAYFEVAKDVKKPFKVFIASGESRGTEIDVLGTHFNVNAYQEEPDIKTTLLEGSVKIRKANAVQMLSPGQQARITPVGIELGKNIDLSQVMAWKEGLFSFDNTDIRVLMRQVERWYDVDVNFEGKVTEEGFSGTVSRNVPLSKFLKALELIDVHIKRDGRKITVMP